MSEPRQTGAEVRFDFKDYKRVAVVSVDDLSRLTELGEPWMGFPPGSLRLDSQSFNELTGVWTAEFTFVDDEAPQPIIVDEAK